MVFPLIGISTEFQQITACQGHVDVFLKIIKTKNAPRHYRDRLGSKRYI
jgi:hypothetical protein